MSSTENYEPPKNGWRTFIILWVSQSISVFGSALTFFGINIYLVLSLFPRDDQKAELAFALSAGALAFALGNVLSAPIAGAWADRHDRKRGRRDPPPHLEPVPYVGGEDQSAGHHDGLHDGPGGPHQPGARAHSLARFAQGAHLRERTEGALGSGGIRPPH